MCIHGLVLMLVYHSHTCTAYPSSRPLSGVSLSMSTFSLSSRELRERDWGSGCAAAAVCCVSCNNSTATLNAIAPSRYSPQLLRHSIRAPSTLPPRLPTRLPPSNPPSPSPPPSLSPSLPSPSTSTRQPATSYSDVVLDRRMITGLHPNPTELFLSVRSRVYTKIGSEVAGLLFQRRRSMLGEEGACMVRL